MWWCERAAGWRLAGRLAAVLAAASLTAGCFEPLYGRSPSPGSESIGDKLAAVQVAPIPAAKGQPVQRLAVELRNELNYKFNGGAGAVAPTHTLSVTIGYGVGSIIVDVASGRPDAQLSQLQVTYSLKEIATGKVVLSDMTFAHLGYDIPGSAQRFAAQRAERDAQDQAVGVAVQAIRNRLASYFVAGT